MSKCTIVGAGLTGAVVANVMSDHYDKVVVYEKKPHVGGNCYDKEINGVLTHMYGAHLFHTNDDRVFDFLSNFTSWHDYEHTVKAKVKNNDHLFDIPINRNTVNDFFGLNLKTDEEVSGFLDAKKIEYPEGPQNAEEQVLSKVGPELYEAFFKHYTIKQWHTDPKELDASITARIPVRHNDDDRYFSDKHQCLPDHGYTVMIERMLNRPNIEVIVNHGIEHAQPVKGDILIWTAPIDQYFSKKRGKLGYRSLHFDFEELDQEQFQGHCVVNYNDDAEPFTRILEMKHATGQKTPNTVIVREFPRDEGDPYYPMLTEKNKQVLDEYKTMAASLDNVYFAGRMGNYSYINMDQAVGKALTLCDKILEEEK